LLPNPQSATAIDEDGQTCRLRGRQFVTALWHRFGYGGRAPFGSYKVSGALKRLLKGNPGGINAP
jgi:hypothetical protein